MPMWIILRGVVLLILLMLGIGYLEVIDIEESKDLSSLALDELVGNLKVHEVIIEKDFEVYKGKKKRVNSIALKAKKESIDDETSKSVSEDEKYALSLGTLRISLEKRFEYQNHLIDECSKLTRNKDQKAFVGGSSSDSENEDKEKTNEETCLMAQSSNERLIHRNIENRTRQPLKSSLKNGLGFEKTESRSKIPPPRRTNSFHLRLDLQCNTSPYADHNIVRFSRRLTTLLCGPHVKTSWQVTQASTTFT
nr:hypothetical protein [Tanacetum cinerariifolium]